jgi:hypothetical protein
MSLFVCCVVVSRCAGVSTAQDPDFVAAAASASASVVDVAVGEEKAPTGEKKEELQVLDLRFDAATIKSGSLQNDTTVQAQGTGHVLGREGVSAGKATFEFLLKSDSANDEAR